LEILQGYFLYLENFFLEKKNGPSLVRRQEDFGLVRLVPWPKKGAGISAVLTASRLNPVILQGENPWGKLGSKIPITFH